MISVKEYAESSPIELPFISKKHNYRIDFLQSRCYGCGRQTVDLRGKITEYENCIEARYAGACHECMGITTHQIRWLPKGEVIITNSGVDGWIERKMKRTGILGRIFDRIEFWFTGKERI